VKNIPTRIYRLSRRPAWLVFLALLLTAVPHTALAQTGGNYDLTWWTVDSGGSGGGVDNDKQLTGGTYELLSTVGQAEATTSGIAGGSYTLQSGFWPGYIPITNVYLPVLLKRHPPNPDLVGSFTLTPSGPNFSAGNPVTINVVVTNQGPVAAGAFWVDFYINPSRTPTVNSRWNDLCSMNPCYGLAWYVPSLAAGQSVNLSSNNPAGAYTNWPGYFAGGTSSLQLYVDSWNPGVSWGGVGEWDETNNRYVYPGGVTVTGLAVAGEETAAPDLPPRPARLAQ